MLVLTRKSNQSIMIGDDIEVSVLAIMGEKVRIGIRADRSVPVFRTEVYLEIQAEQAAETADSGGDAPAGGDEPAASRDESGRNGDESAHNGGESAHNGRREVDAALRSLGESG